MFRKEDVNTAVKIHSFKITEAEYSAERITSNEEPSCSHAQANPGLEMMVRDERNRNIYLKPLLLETRCDGIHVRMFYSLSAAGIKSFYDSSIQEKVLVNVPVEGKVKS